MTNRSNDDIANALRGLASGEHAEPEHGADADAAHAAPPPHAVPTQPAPPAPPAAPAPRAHAAAPPRPAPRPPAQPKPIAPARPVRPVEPGAGPTPQRSPVPGIAAPARPAAPTAPRGAVSPGYRAVAAPPSTPPPAQVPAAQADFVTREAAAAVDDDDAVIMPAPSQQYLAHVTHPSPHPKRSPLGRSAAFRNTLIPVLFTGAALLVTAAAMKYLVHPDAPLAAMPTWLVVVLAAGGIALAVVAVLNLLQLRRPPAAADATR